MAEKEKTGAQPMTSANIKSADKPDPKDKRDFLVTVYATKDAPHHEEGTATKVHPNHADAWIKKGWFTKEAPKSAKKEEDLL